MNKKKPTPLSKNKAPKNNSYIAGFTLIEILVSALVLSLVISGLSYVFLAGKRHGFHSRTRVQAIELGRLFVAPLQMDVTMTERSSGAQNGWGQANNGLNTGVRYCDDDAGHTQQLGCPSQAERTIDGVTYEATYTVNQDTPIDNINKVKVDITWSEPAP